MARFEENRRAVTSAGLVYSAFVTVEASGNSGVSDTTRQWALTHVDEPILMSYFACSVSDQIRWLEPLLSFADRVGRRDAVRIALLMGTKSAGREMSCERTVDEAGLQRFVRELHLWALTHPSYGGLVVETNERHPRYDLTPAPLGGRP
jgi:hypothetical protein